MIEALIAVTGLGSLGFAAVALVLALKWKDADAATLKLASKNEALSFHLTSEKRGRADDVARLEAVIAAKNAEINRLEEYLNADPTAVRDRLFRGGLLGGATTPADPAGQAGSVSDNAAPGVGEGVGGSGRSD